MTSSRNWRSQQRVWDALDALLAEHGRLLVRHGGCRRGGDLFAACWIAAARRAGADVTEDSMEAEWRMYRGYAGKKRNLDMIAKGADLCVAFLAACEQPGCLFNGMHPSHGASHCEYEAGQAGIPVRLYREDGQ